jgi:hypothetical protein
MILLTVAVGWLFVVLVFVFVCDWRDMRRK